MRNVLRIVLSAAAGVGLLAVFMAWGGVSPREVVSMVLRLPLRTYLACLAVHVGVYWLRAQRFRLLLPAQTRPGLATVAAVSAAHNMASYVLPAKSGEATFVLYLKGLCGVPLSAGLASLLVSRLYDFATLCAAVALACAWLSMTPHWAAPVWVGWGLAGILAAASAAFLLLSLRGEKAAHPLRLALRALRLEPTRLGRSLSAAIQRVADALPVARAGASVRVLFALSLLVWLGIFVFYALLSRGFGLPERVGLLQATFASGLAIASNVLPINAFAGFGTQETGWVLGFGLLGIDRASALASGLAVHLVQLFNVCLLGLLGHLAMGALPRRSTERAADEPR